MVRRLEPPAPGLPALGAECCNATEAPGSADLQTGDLGTQALPGADGPLAEALQVRDRARLYSRDELQESKWREGRDSKQGHALDDARDAAGASQQPRGKRQH